MSRRTDIIQALEPGDVVHWIDEHLHRNERHQPFRLMDHQRAILREAFTFEAQGRLRYDTIIYSCVKKSGKTTINAAVTLWFSLTMEAPNEVLVVANDLEQAQGRVFRAIQGLLKYNPEVDPGARLLTKDIRLSNGSVITAIASEYAGAAGSNQGLTSWDELWGYSSESATRLYEELTPVPTRRNSIRFISTYAGWENESTLLWELYKQAVGREEHPEGMGVRLHPDLPLYGNRDARVMAYWDHEPRMPWQSEAYYAGQQRTLRPGTFLRLHRNQWAVAETTFITPELWDPCVDLERRPLAPSTKATVFVGVDAATKYDTAAVAAVCYGLDPQGREVLALARHRIWQPSPEQPLDLEDTIEAYLRGLQREFHVASVYCDPWQLHRSLTTLRKQGLRIEEFPQSVPNTTRMGQQLFECLQGRTLILYPAPDLRQQALHTVAVEHQRGWRIAKEKASHKIDAIVALSMACVAAVDGKGRDRFRFAPVGT